MTFDSKQKPSFLPRLKFFKLRFKRPSPRKMVVVFALFLIFSFIFLNLGHAFAQKVVVPMPKESASALANPLSSSAGLGANAIAMLSTPILQGIAAICALLVDIAAQFLTFMLKPELYNFSLQPIIKIGWEMVRNVCNLFFLLILLFIAFCTILRIEKYHAKKTLLTLIIMALLINFSKPIAIFVFDGSQLLMNYFLNVNKDPVTTISNLTKIAELVYKDLPGFFKTFVSTTFVDAAGQYIFAIIFSFMYAVVLFCLAIFLLIRIIAIWLLIIVSPIAFLAAAIPDFNKISSQWWNALFRYSYVGPAIAFFIWLASQLGTTYFQSLAPQAGVVSMKNFIAFMAVIVFLYTALIMAQSFGIHFAGAITGRANQFMKWAGKGVGYRMPKWAASRTGIPGAVRQKVESVPFAKRWLTKEGWKGSLEDREARMAERMGVSGARETLNKKRTAELRERWKKEGKTTSDFERSLDSRNDIERRSAALELHKQNKIESIGIYEKVLDALKGGHATAADAVHAKDNQVMEVVKSVKKKRVDLVAEFEDRNAVLKRGRPRQRVFDEVYGSIKPGNWGEQKLSDIVPTAEFQTFANNNLGRNMPAAARLELAKNLDTRNAAVFRGQGWV